jgi:hypothetical protein
MRTTSATAAALAVAVLPIRAETFQKVQTEVRRPVRRRCPLGKADGGARRDCGHRCQTAS